ncbi:MAG: hypothetical protein E6936_13630 [Clostridium perfringens]|nr:hypothetical protein [Clostridium perfringens]
MDNKTCIKIFERMLKENRVDFKNEIKNNNQDKIINLADEIEALNYAISFLENTEPKTVIFI